MLIKTLALSLLSLAAVGATANAQVNVLDNLSTNPGAYATTGNSVGQSFTTGGTAFSLADVVFPQMGGPAGARTDGFVATETFVLYGSTGAAGSVAPDFTSGALGTFSLLDETSAGGFAQILATPTATINLAASTRYWLVLSAGGATTTYWTAPDTATVPYTQKSALGVNVATDNHTAYKTVGAVTTYYSYGSGPQLIYIDAVPEPSTYCLMAVAGLALVVSRKRKLA